MGFLYISSAGMDASAQTGSHELTIPNDVSAVISCLLFYSVCKKAVPLLVSLFFLLFVSFPHALTFFSFLLSSLVALLDVRVQRSMRFVRCQGLRSKLPTLWRAQLTDRSPSLAPMPVSAWLSIWSMLGKRLCASATHPLQSSKLTEHSSVWRFTLYLK